MHYGQLPVSCYTVYLSYSHGSFKQNFVLSRPIFCTEISLMQNTHDMYDTPAVYCKRQTAIHRIP